MPEVVAMHQDQTIASPLDAGRRTPCGSAHRLSAACRWRGFSMVEIVIVLVIVGILAAIAIPRVATSVARKRVETAARRIAADLDFARHRARQTSGTVAVVFNVPADRYSLPGVPHMDFPDRTYEVVLTDPPYHTSIIAVNLGGSSQIKFDGFGAPDSGGTITISSGNYTLHVIVDANTGRTTVEEYGALEPHPDNPIDPQAPQGQDPPSGPGPLPEIE